MALALTRTGAAKKATTSQCSHACLAASRDDGHLSRAFARGAMVFKFMRTERGDSGGRYSVITFLFMGESRGSSRIRRMPSYPFMDAGSRCSTRLKSTRGFPSPFGSITPRPLLDQSVGRVGKSLSMIGRVYTHSYAFFTRGGRLQLLCGAPLLTGRGLDSLGPPLLPSSGNMLKACATKPSQH